MMEDRVRTEWMDQSGSDDRGQRMGYERGFDMELNQE
jgi:hypothetical protein